MFTPCNKQVFNENTTRNLKNQIYTKGFRIYSSLIYNSHVFMYLQAPRSIISTTSRSSTDSNHSEPITFIYCAFIHLAFLAFIWPNRIFLKISHMRPHNQGQAPKTTDQVDDQKIHYIYIHTLIHHRILSWKTHLISMARFSLSIRPWKTCKIRYITSNSRLGRNDSGRLKSN